MGRILRQAADFEAIFYYEIEKRNKRRIPWRNQQS